ncbi:MAG TPA: hypothetical protein VGE22_00035 [Solimonas sp.]
MPLSATITDDRTIVDTDRDIMSLDRFISIHARSFLRNMLALAGIRPASPWNSYFFRHFARQGLVGSDNFGQLYLIPASGFAYNAASKPAYRYALSTLPFDTCHVPLTAALSQQA